MNPAVRWLLLVPAALAGSVAAYVGGTLLWNVVRLINIVPQNSYIDVGLAAVGINGIAGATGVLAGAAVAPSNKPRVAAAMAALLVLLALLTLAMGAAFRDRLSMAIPWHVVSTIAWIVGAVAAARHVWKESAPRRERMTPAPR